MLTIAASNVTLNLGGQVHLADGHGVFVVTPGGLAGRLGGTVTIDAAGFSGNFTVAVNTGTRAVHESITVGGMPATLDLPLGPYLRVEGQATLAIAGQTLSGQFAFEQATDASARRSCGSPPRMSGSPSVTDRPTISP